MARFFVLWLLIMISWVLGTMILGPLGGGVAAFVISTGIMAVPGAMLWELWERQKRMEDKLDALLKLHAQQNVNETQEKES